MAETNTSEDNKYTKCSKCRLKYKNEDKHEAHDFGYNRLGEQFKTCFICRDKQKRNERIAKKKRNKITIKKLLTNITTRLIKN